LSFAPASGLRVTGNGNGLKGRGAGPLDRSCRLRRREQAVYDAFEFLKSLVEGGAGRRRHIRRIQLADFSLQLRQAPFAVRIRLGMDRHAETAGQYYRSYRVWLYHS
jgi:hypothetical protein